MDGDEEDVGWDGPNIRPPPVKQDSGNRNRFGSDRRHHHGSSSHGGKQHHSRSSSHHDRSDRSSSRQDSRQGQSRGREGRESRDRRVPVEDLRGRIGQAKGSGSEYRHGSSSREKERQKNVKRQEGSNRGSDRRQHRDGRKVDVQSSRRDQNRDDAEIRRQRQEVLRQAKAEEERVRRKRERSRSRSSDTRKQQKRQEAAVAKVLDGGKVETEEEEEESESGSGNESENESSSENEGSESGEVESSSGSEDETGSEEAEATPEHDDDDDDEDDEVEVEQEQTEAEKPKQKSESSRRSTNSEAPSRTPSRSPTPRRRSDDEETLEARAMRNLSREASPDESHDSEYEDDQHERDPEPEIEEEEKEELPPYLPSVYGCRNMDEFEVLNKVEEGTYGVVYRAIVRKTKEIVALKRLKMEKEKDGFPITSLREINTLLISQHPNVVTVREIVVGSDMDRIYIVMDFVEHDLKSLMDTMREKQQVFLPGEIKCLMLQLLRAIAYLHDNWILHRDIKASNLLLSHNGILKVGDFGLAREYGSPLKAYTSVVVTLWYRAPELLLGTREYSTPIDVWSVGCIFGELLQMKPLLTGKSDPDQLQLIYKLLGSPNEKIWPGFSKLPVVPKLAWPDVPAPNLRSRFPQGMVSECGLALFKKFLTYDPKRRITCEDAMKDEYFKEHPLAIDPSMFPTWPAKSEMSGRHAKKAGSPKPPSGGGAFKQMNKEDNDYGGFILSGGKAPAPAPWKLNF